jgi:hypothetical protein
MPHMLKVLSVLYAIQEASRCLRRHCSVLQGNWIGPLRAVCLKHNPSTLLLYMRSFRFKGLERVST